MTCVSHLLSLPTTSGLTAWAGQTNLPASVTWIGPTDGEFSWLVERIQACLAAVGGVLHCHGLQSPDGLSLYHRFALTQTDRLIVACRNRWDYPELDMRRLAAERCDVPLALATSDWWLGWNRTGVGHLQTLPHLSLPWYRWWDGWAAWLCGRHAEMYGPFPNLISGIRPASQMAVQVLCTLNSGLTEKTESLSCQTDRSAAVPGLVLADCSITAQSWVSAVGGVAIRVQDLFSKSQDHQAAALKQLDWIIWDDSCLCTSRGVQQARQAAIEQLQTVVDRHSSTRLWLGLTQPRWDDIVAYQQAGLKFDLLVKPFYGFVL